MRVLVVGPSPTRSKGGMSTVIDGICRDKKLNEEVSIDIYESYTDGNKLHVSLYSVFAYFRFIMRKNGYDIYHIHAASYGSTFRKGLYVDAVKRWGKRVIFHIHGAEYIKFYNGLSERKQKRVKEILRKADMVIALSEDWKKKFVEMFDLKNCVVLENGIDMEELKPAICDITEHINEFAVLGRLGQRKGTFDLIDAVEIAVRVNPNIICYLAGDGEIEKTKEIIEQKNLQDNIKVLGWLSGKEKVKLLSKVSTVVLPSYNEGLPMSILEGMACGKAIISTKVGAIPEVVKDVNGILLTPGDISSLANALIACCRNADMIKKMSEANIVKIEEKYSSTIMHNKLVELYQKVCS